MVDCIPSTYDEVTDDTLVRRAQSGDRFAFGILCDRYLTTVYRRLCALLPPEAVEDVTQEVFMAAMMSLQRFRFSASFRTWLTGIVRHKVVDYYRARGRRGEMISLEAHGVPTTCSKESYSEVRLAVAELPAHYQEVLLLRFAEDLPFQEIAAMLGLSLEATKSRYRRAVRAFAKAYGGNGQE